MPNDVVLVPERDLERAVAMLVGIEKTVVEGAGAAGLAAMLADPERFTGKKVATILCGGNIDTHLLANVLVRDLVRQGRIARLRVAAQDRPGALAAITAKVYEAGVNIIEINHSRIFTRLPAKDTVIEVECEARDAAGDRRRRRAAGSRRIRGRTSACSTDSASGRHFAVTPGQRRLNPRFGCVQTLFNGVYQSHKESA